MNFDQLLTNFLSPPILFFLLGLLATLVEAVRPLLKKIGGLCLVSDVLSVMH